MKAKKMIWRSDDGRELSLRDMETDHLHNLIAYLYRRLEEFNRLAELALKNDLILPKPRTQGYLQEEWVQAGMKELARREDKGREEAQKRLGIHERKTQSED